MMRSDIDDVYHIVTVTTPHLLAL
eukprot:COSAG04_NODE_18041_length_452_cov_1.433428_1_plen_23_part_10